MLPPKVQQWVIYAWTKAVKKPWISCCVVISVDVDTHELVFSDIPLLGFSMQFLKIDIVQMTFFLLTFPIGKRHFCSMAVTPESWVILEPSPETWRESECLRMHPKKPIWLRIRSWKDNFIGGILGTIFLGKVFLVSAYASHFSHEK